MTANKSRARRGELLNWCMTVAHADSDSCIPWPFGKGVRDYGRVRYQGTHRLATHVVLILSGQPRPAAPNDQALHSCDTPSCCNPRHLRWGSVADNMNDRDGRQRGQTPDTKGEAHGRAKLSDDDVRNIRRYLAQGATQRAIGELYGVAPSVISRIKTGKRWAHVV